MNNLHIVKRKRPVTRWNDIQWFSGWHFRIRHVLMLRVSFISVVGVFTGSLLATSSIRHMLCVMTLVLTFFLLDLRGCSIAQPVVLAISVDEAAEAR